MVHFNYMKVWSGHVCMCVQSSNFGEGFTILGFFYFMVPWQLF